MRLSVVCAALLLSAPWPAAIAADPPDDDAALQLADKPPAAAAPGASPLKMYAEGAVSNARLRGTSSSVTGERASLDLRLDATLAPGWRAVLSDRFDGLHDNSPDGAHSVNALREAYLRWQWQPDVTADAGRINIRHGVAWGYNPTDFFRDGALRSIVTPDPAALRENRLGTVALQAQKVWSDSAFTATFSPKLATSPNDATLSPDFGSTNNRHRWLLAASHRFGPQFNPELLLHGGVDTPTQVGLNLSAALGQATVVFAELSGGRGPTLREQTLGEPKSDRWQKRGAVGLTYTTAFNLSLTAEYDHDSAAPDRAQWDSLSASAVDALRFLRGARTAQELPARRAAFFYATWRDAVVRRLDLSAYVREELVTHSRDHWFEARYHLDRADVALQWQQYSGDAQSIFGRVPVSRTVELSGRFYF